MFIQKLNHSAPFGSPLKRIACAAFRSCLLMVCLCSTASAEAPSEQSAITCNQGPIFRNFGGTWWFVYACTDNESLALVSLPYNPACPYYFVISKAKNGRYTVNGFGNDAEKTIPDVKTALGELTTVEISALIMETNGETR